MGIALRRLPVQALLEDGDDALVVERADSQRPFTGFFQPRLAVATGELEQSQAGAIAVLGVGAVFQLLLDHLPGAGADVLGPVQEAAG